MLICKRCRGPFPNWITIEGKPRNLRSRKFCLKCSPFGAHNTVNIANHRVRRYLCACGETDPDKFYGKKRNMCARCDNQYTVSRNRSNKANARALLGGKCQICGYDKYQVALDIHHTQPDLKDPNFNRMRGWSWKRIVKELETCILLCRNCHTAVECGELTYIIPS